MWEDSEGLPPTTPFFQIPDRRPETHQSYGVAGLIDASKVAG